MPRKKAKNNKKSFETVIRDSIIILVAIVWVATIIIDIKLNYDIPNSVQVAFTMIVGYLLGDKVINNIRNKDKK